MLERLDGVQLAVRDLNAACDDYAALLGRPPVWRGRHADAGARVVRWGLANTLLELIEEGPDAVAPEPGSGALRRLRFGSGLAREALAEGLAERGLEVAPTRCRLIGDPGHPDLEWSAVTLDRDVSRGLGVELACEAGAAAPGGPVDAAAPHALDHVVVLSADAEAKRAFYGETLGLRLALDRTFEDRGVRLLFFRVGGVTVEIGTRSGVAARNDRPDGFGGLAWQVGDVEAMQARLAASGFDVSRVRAGHKLGTFVCTVKDRTHGVPTLLIQPVSR